MELRNIMQNRRSVRRYTGEAVPAEKLELVLQAGLLAFSGRARRPWEFIVVRDKAMLETLSRCRPHGPAMLAGADCAIVVVADPGKTDVWVEDCSIAMTQMHLMADALGLGSCWVQVRLREAPDGGTAEDYLRAHLNFPAEYKAEAILSIGIPAEHAPAYDLDSLQTEKIHWDKYGTFRSEEHPESPEEHLAYLQNARYPQGSDGRHILARMRESHTDVTTWTIDLVDAQPDDVVLDIGCGGGRALRRIAPKVTTGKLYGVDYAETAVACTKEENAADIASGKMVALQGSVSELPFADDTFDKIFSIESYYFWPDLQQDVQEILRVLKPGGKVFITADIHDRPGLPEAVLENIRSLNMTNLSFAAFEALLKDAGYRNVVIHGKEGTDWMCAEGTK